MESFSALARCVFAEAVKAYLREGSIDATCPNPYPEGTIKHDLYRKNWIDHAQWALEDLIRDPDIQSERALALKRQIDRSNQARTDLVERIDSYFYELYAGVTPKAEARINTESPAWAIDRLSILKLKIHYMGEAARNATTERLRLECEAKLSVLRTQEVDLSTAIDELLQDIQTGDKYMKVYKQMKMYNDPELNPMLKGKPL